MKKVIGLASAVLLAGSFALAPVAFADAAKGKEIFNSKAKKCKTCHKAAGDPAKFKPVGPGLKGVGKRLGKDYLAKWLSPNNIELWGDAIGDKAKITGEPKDDRLKDLLKRYSAAKKGKKMNKSQMVKNFGPGKGGKPPKISLTPEEQGHLIDYLMSL